MNGILPLNHGQLDLNRVNIMGILNLTPDSFSDGGQFNQIDAALHRVEIMVQEGADIIDIGGESTRPGAEQVSAEDELARVVTVVEAIRQRFDIPLSIDTVKPQVMEATVSAGVDLINDVMALQMPGALETAAALNVPVCLMHMQGQPRSMQTAPSYHDVVSEVCDFLRQRVVEATKAGIAKEQILLDPGFGFGKSLEHNYQLLAQLNVYQTLGHPLLVGMSRKSMIGQLLGRETEQRLSGSLACALLAAQSGAKIIRVHDVKETVDVVTVWQQTERFR